MWINKRKHEEKIFEAKLKAMDNMREAQQWERLEKLEREVKKLKKIVRKGY